MLSSFVILLLCVVPNLTRKVGVSCHRKVVRVLACHSLMLLLLANRCCRLLRPFRSAASRALMSCGLLPLLLATSCNKTNDVDVFIFYLLHWSFLCNMYLHENISIYKQILNLVYIVNIITYREKYLDKWQVTFSEFVSVFLRRLCIVLHIVWNPKPKLKN